MGEANKTNALNSVFDVTKFLAFLSFAPACGLAYSIAFITVINASLFQVFTVSDHLKFTASRAPALVFLFVWIVSIRPARTNEIRVPNATSGGACLIAQVEGAAGTCTRDDQCDVRVSNGILQSKWHGYCIGPGGDVGAKRCWFKPSENYCVKRVKEGDHKIPAVDPGEVYKWAKAERGQREVKWMVYGCLNGPVQAGKDPPCAGGPGQAMHDAGPPKVVRP